MGTNTLTNLIPDIYTALDVVSRELVGFIPAVTSDMTFERAAIGQNVRSPVAPAAAATNITPAVIPPDDGDQVFGNVALTIQKAMRVPVRWNGEQSKGVDNNGPGRRTLMVNQFAQGMRTLVNLVEADLAALHAAASRAYGVAGTTPFNTGGDFTEATNALKILKDNGAPTGDCQLIIDTTAGAKMLGLQSRYDIGGDPALQMQNQGVLVQKAGLQIRESAQVLTPAIGTAASYTTDTAGYAAGATTVNLITGTGTLVAGDIIQFAGDTNKYVVAVGLAAPGAVVIAAPGLLKAIPTSATAVTVIAKATRNMAFARTALALATRAPAVPEEGDMAEDAQIISDPRSGLSFEVRMYKQYRQIQYEIGLAWGTKCVKPEHLALLLG